jgi:Fe-Mn family superoxide dismutase
MEKAGGGEPKGDSWQNLQSFGGFGASGKLPRLVLASAGWAWLIVGRQAVDYSYESRHDYFSGKAVLGLDVWEHAYYLK